MFLFSSGTKSNKLEIKTTLTESQSHLHVKWKNQSSIELIDYLANLQTFTITFELQLEAETYLK